MLTSFQRKLPKLEVPSEEESDGDGDRAGTAAESASGTSASSGETTGDAATVVVVLRSRLLGICLLSNPLRALRMEIKKKKKQIKSLLLSVALRSVSAFCVMRMYYNFQ